jgi:hypothetical protein
METLWVELKYAEAAMVPLMHHHRPYLLVEVPPSCCFVGDQTPSSKAVTRYGQSAKTIKCTELVVRRTYCINAKAHCVTEPQLDPGP